ncbi:MAG: DUF6206 family protein [Promethearchaeota archaeon]
MNTDLTLLKKFEDSLDTNTLSKDRVFIHILGYGEMSIVFEILDGINNNAYKRLSIFEEENQVLRHIQAFKVYYKVLTEDIGINIPPYKIIWFRDKSEKIKFFYIQQKFTASSICNKAIHYLDRNSIKNLVLLILKEMRKVWIFNLSQEKIKVGLDAQISNFSIEQCSQNNPIVSLNSELIFLDTIPPFFRINGKEAMDLSLLLKTVPVFLKWLLKINYIQKIMNNVVNRYYDFRTTVIDLIANFSKEQRSDLIPVLIKLANRFFTQEVSELNLEPLTLNEVIKYYKYDRLIWILYQNLRRWDRFMITKLFRKKYEFFLPPKIKR